MKGEDFGSNAPGQLVRIAGDALAFVPNQLPPSLEPSWEIMGAAEKARAAISQLVGQARLITNLEIITRAFARSEAVSSSRIEGTQTEVIELLQQEASQALPSEDSDLHEVLNYVSAINLADEWIAEGRGLDLSLIKELHARLLRGVGGQDKEPGALRTEDVYIGSRTLGFAGARFVPPPMEHVPVLMDGLVQAMNGVSPYGSLVDSAILHYQFETIHPFEDGNGRLGRLLIPMHLRLHGVVDRPLLYLGPYLEAHETAYRDGLLSVSQTGHWESWISFVLNALRETAIDALARVERIIALRADYAERVRLRGERKGSATALDIVFERVVVSVQDIRFGTGVSEPTAGAIVADLEGLGILRLHRKEGARRFWIAAGLVDAIYRPFASS
jgi:Fic family protein